MPVVLLYPLRSPLLSHLEGSNLAIVSLPVDKMITIMWIVIATTVAFSTTASALDAPDFANNAISDLGPLISLFGDQVTTQFLRQSYTIFDGILFAMGPIGIITAVCAAIRVGRITILKALIGKAQESQEAVEVEVLSSTSQDVCEIWNGQELVRVQGNGSVLEIVYQEPARSSSSTIEGKQPALQN